MNKGRIVSVNRRKLILPLLVMFILSVCIFSVPLIFPRPQSAAAEEAVLAEYPKLKEAYFYESLPDNEVECLLCPRKCLLEEGELGTCRVRKNIDGKLFALNYGKSIPLSLEPIEKAPFFHFMPGHTRLCMATVGCNLRCKYCQNWNLSQKKVSEAPYLEELSPRRIVDIALETGARSICFTFSEPISFYEYMYDTALIAGEAGLKTSMVSAGYINREPLVQLLEVLDAVKIDLKGFTEEFYEDVIYGELAPVLDALEIIYREGTWLEIVNLVVPTLNDDPVDIQRMCEWISGNLGPEVPLHFSRFHPMYRLTDLPPTPVEMLEMAYEVAKDTGLKYVYIGNIPGHPCNSTYCPSCGERLIHRMQFSILQNIVDKGKCPFCGESIAGLQ